ncbi:MAG: HNH endonuclease family protein [Pseudomonadota bacterium]
MYSNPARDCSSTKTAQEFADFSAEMLEKFRQRDVSRNEFILNFTYLEYSTISSRDRNLIRYILQSIQSHSSTTPIDYDQYTIEHILPQSENYPHSLYANIGNLILVPEKVNLKLGVKGFKEKKKILIEEGLSDGLIDDWDAADPDTIDDRGRKMAELSFDKIWKL